MDILRQRVPLTICARCRKTIKPGDRVIIAYIVQKIGRNPETMDVGAWIGEDFEFVHASCADTALNGSSLITT